MSLLATGWNDIFRTQITRAVEAALFPPPPLHSVESRSFLRHFDFQRSRAYCQAAQGLSAASDLYPNEQPRRQLPGVTAEPAAHRTALTSSGCFITKRERNLDFGMHEQTGLVVLCTIHFIRCICNLRIGTTENGPLNVVPLTVPLHIA